MFHSWEFVYEWWRHFVVARVGGATGEYEVVVVSTNDGLPVAILPFFVENNLGRVSLGTTLQPFGRSNSFEPMTDSPVAIYRGGFEARALAAAKSHLLRRAGGWDIAAVHAEPSGNPLAEPSRRPVGATNVVEVTRICDGPLSLPLPTSWPAYWATLSKSMRDNLAYYPRKLSRHRPNWRVRAVRSPAAIVAATDALVKLHWMRTASAVGSSHGNHIPTEQHAEFLRRWFSRAAERDQVAIYVLEVDDQIVAAQAFVESPGCIAVYYSGYDERFYRYSPLMIITAQAIRTAIANGVNRVEFPPTPTQWKSRWGALQHRAVVETSFYSSRLQALARGFFRRLYLHALTNQRDRSPAARAPAGPPDHP